MNRGGISEAFLFLPHRVPRQGRKLLNSLARAARGGAPPKGGGGGSAWRGFAESHNNTDTLRRPFGAPSHRRSLKPNPFIPRPCEAWGGAGVGWFDWAGRLVFFSAVLNTEVL